VNEDAHPAGRWHVELDDGSGVGRLLKIDGATALRTGDILPRRLHNRMWRINRVDPARMRARAVPHG
jgi:hypothetical protein